MSKITNYALSLLDMIQRFLSFKNMRFKLQANKGQTWMEYGMIIGGIILVIVLVIGFFGDELLGLFKNIRDAIGINEPEGGSGGAW